MGDAAGLAMAAQRKYPDEDPADAYVRYCEDLVDRHERSEASDALDHMNQAHVTPLLVGGHFQATNELRVWCPYCKKYHHHDWSDAIPSDRALHVEALCDDKSSIYFGRKYYVAIAPLPRS